MTDESESAAKAERARLYEVFASAPAIFCVVRGPKHVFELANARYLELIGRKAEDVIGRPAREVLPELAAQGYWDILDRVYKTGEPFVGKEMPSRLAKGGGALEEAYLDFVYQPIRGASGKVEGILAHAVDVTAHVQARRQMEAFLSATFDVVYKMSADWTEMKHLEGKEFIPDTRDPTRHWLDKYIHPDDQPAVLAAIRRAIQTRSMFELEHRVIRVDGTLGWAHSRALPLLDAKGEIVEWFGAARDVTEQRQAQERLAAQRRLYDAILSSTPDLVYVFDLDHRFTYANQALLKMWGKTWEEAIGKTCLELGYEPWHAAMHDREIEQVKAAKRAVRGDVPFTGTLGRRIYDYIFVPVLDAAGNVEAVAGTTRDVTELRDHAAKLAATVAERTASLTAANNELEAFSYSVSHDLRAPLRRIGGFAELIKRRHGRALPADGQELLDHVISGARKLSEIIEGLLRLSKAGRADLNRELVDLTQLAEGVLDDLRAADPGRRVEAAVAPGLHAVADRVMIRLVLQNLLENAWKFTRDAPRPRIEVGSQTGAGKPVFFVRDNGAGFDARYADKLFTPFQRLHPAAQYPGTGIGLATTRRIIERHGGRIWAESKPGEGAVFYFTLSDPSPSKPELS